MVRLSNGVRHYAHGGVHHDDGRDRGSDVPVPYKSMRLSSAP